MSKENGEDGKTSRLRPYIVTCIGSLIQLQFGMSIAWMSPAAIALQADPPEIGGSHAYSGEEINWLGSLTYIGCLAGILFWGTVAEKIGRKNTCCLLALPVIVGWSLILVAQSVKWMYLGRLILGLSGTGALIPLQLYLNEISEDSYRGTLTSIMVSFFNAGIAIAYVFGSLLSLRTFTIICNVFPFIHLIAFYSFPESPVYLYKQNKRKQAEMSLLWYRNDNYVKVQKELTRIDENLSCRLERRETIQFRSLYEGKARAWAFFINLWLFLVQQFCGIIEIITFTSLIIKSSGSSLIAPDNGAIFVGILQLILSWIVASILEKTSRRFLLMVSLGGMAFSQLFLGWYFLNPIIFPNWLPLVSICFHVASYCLGLGPLPFVISAEITHPKVQPIAFTVFCLWATALSFASLKTYPYLVKYFGEHGCFWCYAALCLISMLATPKILPETKGRTFDQITKSLEGVTKEDNDLYQELRKGCNVNVKRQQEKV